MSISMRPGKRKRLHEQQSTFDEELPSQNGSAGNARVSTNEDTSSPGSSHHSSWPQQSPLSWSHPNHDSAIDPSLDPGRIYRQQSRPVSSDTRGGSTNPATQWRLPSSSRSGNAESQHRSPGNSDAPSYHSLNRYDDANRGIETIPAVPDVQSGLTRASIESPSNNGASPNDVPLPSAASFFRTYFTVIHPQYPFLDIKLCSDYYIAWKSSISGSALSGWPAFFVNMIFAIGSLIESKSDNSPYFNNQNLKSRAQAEQSIMADSTSTPLIRLQAMLLSAMFALHAENTWRIAHISGVVMKFASLHRFHRLKRDPSDPTNLMSIRVWSSAFVLDRAISSALGTPVSLPDMYISTPLFEVTADVECPLPWLSDCNSSGDSTYPDLRTFAHVCKIRAIQSFFMHIIDKDGLEDSVPFELEMHMLQKLREWESPELISRHSDKSGEGYQSALWLRHIGHLTRLSICFVNKSNISSSMADNALQAACSACHTFRSLQKKKQVALPWLVVLSQFRAAVTLWYIIWARAIAVPRTAHDAFRDCSAVLAIFAERWPKAEYYRDCFEHLASSIPRCQPLGHMSQDIRSDLTNLVHKVEETGIHRTTLRMLREMCSGEGLSPRQI